MALFSCGPLRKTRCLVIGQFRNYHHYKSQENIKPMLMLNFGGTNKEYYGIFDSG